MPYPKPCTELTLTLNPDDPYRTRGASARAGRGRDGGARRRRGSGRHVLHGEPNPNPILTLMCDVVASDDHCWGLDRVSLS